MKTLPIILLLIPLTAQAADLTGTVTHVRDGDTIVVDNTPVRLSGVSAPELKEPLGQESKEFMTNLVMNKKVVCELDGTKTYDRVVGICYLDGVDVGVSVIQAGLARDCPRYSKGRYQQYEPQVALAVIQLPEYCHVND